MEAISVSVSNELTAGEQTELFTLFEGDFDRLGEGQRLSPEWVTWIMIAKDAGIILTAANGAVTFAKNLIAFRDKLVKRGKRPSVQVTSAGSSLDLAEASNEEIVEWMIHRSRANDHPE